MENNSPDEQLPSRIQKYHNKKVSPDTKLAPPVKSQKQKPAPSRDRKPKSSSAKGWIITILLAIIISLVLRIFVFEIVMVDGDSMLPTLNSDQRVVVEKISRYFSLPPRGDIVITKYPNMPGYYVKRLIGYPGDTIEIKSNAVYVNGFILQENYLSPGESYADMGQITVPAGTIFVMGDNRPKSLDSRAAAVGPIPVDDMLGVGLFVIWPFDQIHVPV